MSRYQVQVGKIVDRGEIVKDLKSVVIEGELLAHLPEANPDSRGAAVELTLYRTDDWLLLVHKRVQFLPGKAEVLCLQEVSPADLDVGGEYELLGREAGFARSLTAKEGLEYSRKICGSLQGAEATGQAQSKQPKEIRKEVQRLLDEAASLLTALPSEQWAGWVIYLSESIESEAAAGVASRDAIENYVARLGRAFDERARRGMW